MTWIQQKIRISTTRFYPYTGTIPTSRFASERTSSCETMDLATNAHECSSYYYDSSTTATALGLLLLLLFRRTQERLRRSTDQTNSAQLKSALTSSTACLLLEHFPVRALTFSSSTAEGTSTSLLASGHDLPIPKRLWRPEDKRTETNSSDKETTSSRKRKREERGRGAVL